MTGPAYRAAIERLGLSIAAAGRFFEVNPTTGRRWAKDGPPPTVGICLKIMIAGGISVEQANKWLGRKATF